MHRRHRDAGDHRIPSDEFRTPESGERPPQTGKTGGDDQDPGPEYREISMILRAGLKNLVASSTFIALQTTRLLLKRLLTKL